MRARKFVSVPLIALMAAAPIAAQSRQTQAPPAAPAQAAAHNLSVTVKYTGKGPVDAAHDILVFMFDNPTINQNSRPIGMQSVTMNGGVAVFKDVAPAKVYVVALYDVKGDYDGRSGPPAPDTPMGYYNPTAKATVPAAITPGAKTAVTLSFDGSVKFKQ